MLALPLHPLPPANAKLAPQSTGALAGAAVEANGGDVEQAVAMGIDWGNYGGALRTQITQQGPTNPKQQGIGSTAADVVASPVARSTQTPRSALTAPGARGIALWGLGM